MKKFLVWFLVIFLLGKSVVHAEMKIYNGIGEYFLIDGNVDFVKD